AAVAQSGPMLAAGLVLCTTLVLNGPGSLRAVFQLRVRNDVNAAVELANGILWGTAAIVISARGGGLVPLAIAFALTSALTTAIQVGLALRVGRVVLRGSRALWGDLARGGIPVGVGGLLIL